MTTPGRTRVLLAEDSALLRAGLTHVLEHAGMEVVGVAGDADRLLTLVAELLPDLAVTDIRMPPTQTTEGLRAARHIRRDHPGIGVLVLSQHVETETLFELLGDDPAGFGYLLKDRIADVAEFTAAVRRVASGGSVIDPDVVARLVARGRRDRTLDRLTDRERDVLGLMAQGRSNPAIARALVLSDKTVETHVGHIFSKLGIESTGQEHRRVLAVLTALGRG
ncbi:LuxR C-terminal-related transcriptional regulator [Nakamurella sp.]|uniref:LuxR C-terminal-related transcriptional regulator n=1 Tax=Nakamurella sp. TaxID=1869182 RepID=UPI003B3A22C7